jgi:hypothetical protein
MELPVHDIVNTSEETFRVGAGAQASKVTIIMLSKGFSRAQTSVTWLIKTLNDIFYHFYYLF